MMGVNPESNFPSPPTADELASKLDSLEPEQLRRLIREALHALGDPEAWWRVSSEALVHLANRHGGGAVLRAVMPWKDASEFWSFLPILERLIPAGPFDSDSIRLVFDGTPESVYGDLAIGTYAAMYRSWANRHPADAEALFRCCAGESPPKREFLLLPLAEGVVNAAAAGDYDVESFRDFLGYIATSEDERVRRTFLALNPLLLEKDYRTEAEVLACLDEVLRPSSPEPLAAAATTTVRFLWDISRREPLRALIRKSAADDRPWIRLAVAEVLFHPLAESADPADQPLTKELLLGLVDTDESHQAIISKIALALFVLARRAPELVLLFLREWIVKRPRGSLYVWDSRRFLHVLSELPSAVLVPEMVRWLVTASELESAALATLGRELAMAAFPVGTATSLSDAEIEALVLVLAIHDEEEHSVDLLFSLVAQIEAHRDFGEFWGEVEQSLAHAVANFRGGATQRLKAIKGAENPNVRAIVAKLVQLDASLRGVLELSLRLRELDPPFERSRSWDRIETARTAALIREAEKDDPGRTPLYHLIPKVQVLGPGSFVFAREGQLTSPTQMRSHSIAFELPRLALIDPHTEMRRRVYLRRRLQDIRTNMKP